MVYFLLAGQRLVQLFLEIRNPAVLQFGHAGQVIGPMRFLQFRLGALELLLQMSGALHRGLLRFPDILEIGELRLEPVHFRL